MKKTILFTLVLFFLMQAAVFGLERDEQINAFRGRIQGMLKQGVLPVIDVEYHHGGNIENERLVAAMDKNGVALIWVGPNERIGSVASIRLNELYPDRFVPTTVHGDGKLWHSSDRGFLEKLEKDVLSGKYFAMGEFEARHYQSEHQ